MPSLTLRLYCVNKWGTPDSNTLLRFEGLSAPRGCIFAVGARGGDESDHLLGLSDSEHCFWRLGDGQRFSSVVFHPTQEYVVIDGIRTKYMYR